MIELIDLKSIPRISDWAELNVIFLALPLSKSKMISLLEDNGYEEDEDYDGEELFDSIIQELQRREKLYGNTSPFKVDNNIIHPEKNWENCPEYMMCLLFSYWGAENAANGTQLFERLSNIVLKVFLKGNAITLGFPNTGNLPGQMKNLATELCEERGSKNPPAAAKDRGVDVVGWLSSEDGRRGQIIVLMQCAAGRTWNKKKRIMLDVWSQYINWNKYTSISSLSITEVVDTKKWSNAVEEYGVVFDRARIYRCLYENEPLIDLSLRNDIILWCMNKLN